MKITRAYSGFRFVPRLFRAQDPRAPFSTIIHVGCWLVFLGERK